MALYISAGRRRRTTIMVGVAAAIVGLLLGFLLGRGTTTTIDDRISASRDAGRKFAAALRVLPLEYEQAVTDELTLLLGSAAGEPLAAWPEGALIVKDGYTLAALDDFEGLLILVPYEDDLRREARLTTIPCLPLLQGIPFYLLTGQSQSS